MTTSGLSGTTAARLLWRRLTLLRVAFWLLKRTCTSAVNLSLPSLFAAKPLMTCSSQHSTLLSTIPSQFHAAAV